MCMHASKWGRGRETETETETERERLRISSRPHVVSSEPSMGLDPIKCEIVT